MIKYLKRCPLFDTKITYLKLMHPDFTKSRGELSKISSNEWKPKNPLTWFLKRRGNFSFASSLVFTCPSSESKQFQFLRYKNHWKLTTTVLGFGSLKFFCNLTRNYLLALVLSPVCVKINFIWENGNDSFIWTKRISRTLKKL